MRDGIYETTHLYVTQTSYIFHVVPRLLHRNGFRQPRKSFDATVAYIEVKEEYREVSFHTRVSKQQGKIYIKISKHSMKSIVSLFFVTVLALAFVVSNVSAGDCEGKWLNVVYR